MAKAAQKEVTALPAADVKQLEPVDDGTNYRVTFQLGASRRWRQFSGGEWVPDDTKRAKEGESHYRHVPAIHEHAGPFSGFLVNGLISLHNKWQEQNRNREQGGEVQHQFVLLNVVPTEDGPVDRVGQQMSGLAAVLRPIIRETVTAIMEEFTKAK